MVIKVGKEFLKKMYRNVLTDLSVSRKDFGWYIEQFEDCYVTEDNEFKLGDGDKSFFVDSIEELTVDGYDEFSLEIVEGKDVVLSLDSGDEDGEELEDSFYDLIYEVMERYSEEGGVAGE
jgi:hypothetical protein